MNNYIFETKRTKCPYCGSSDGFARVLHPTTKEPVADNIGKCHSCAVFRTQTEAGFISESGDLVASKGVVQAKYFDVSALPKFGLTPARSSLVRYVDNLTGSEIGERVAASMYVFGDVWGNTAFVYADASKQGMSVKTIAYDADAHRVKEGLAIGAKRLETSQIAGYIPAEGVPRYARVADGAYQFLYNQHNLEHEGSYHAIVLVESEKTAYISTALADMLGIPLIFLSAGGTNGVSLGKIRSLTAANAVSDKLLKLIRAKPMVICYDADEPGEKGSIVAKEALESLGLKPIVYNMSAILQDVPTSMAVPQQKSADLADVIANAMAHGAMLDEIESVLKAVYNKALGIVHIQSIIANNELSKLTNADYCKPAPTASLTFTDETSGKESQLAIPGNIVMLLASPGVGKSSVISAMVARHIMPAANAFGLDIHAPNGLVIIDTEQSKDQVVILHRRLARRMGCDVEELPQLFEQTNVNWYVSDKRLTEEKQVDNLFAAIAESNPSFVIVDQVGSLVRDVNNNDQVKALIRRIATDAESNMRTWVVVLHTNPTSDKGRGNLGSDIHRWASSVLFIRKPAESGDPSLLTTSNIDGMMAKVRSGPPVRCFFAWDDAQGDFYPTTKEDSVIPDMTIVRSAIDEIFQNGDAVAKPLPLTELRQRMKDVFGAKEGKVITAYVMKERYIKRTANGLLWPDYEKLQNIGV